MDDKCKLMLTQALQNTIRLKEEVWRLNDLLAESDPINKTSRELEIKEIQDQLGVLLDI